MVTNLNEKMEVWVAEHEKRWEVRRTLVLEKEALEAKRVASVSPVAGKHLNFADFHEDILRKEGAKVMTVGDLTASSVSYRKAKWRLLRLQKDWNQTWEHKRQEAEVNAAR